MVKVCYKKGLIRMMDIYGTALVDREKNLDIIISENVLLPSTNKEFQNVNKGVLHCYSKSLVIDLQRSEEEIFSGIHKNTKYKINRAIKRDDIVYHELSNPTDEQIQRFVTFFNNFAKYKNLPMSNFTRLKGLRDQNALIISYVTDKDLNVLCYHAYVRTEDYCSLLYSASGRFENSKMNSLIGRANRFLHWQDIRSFKEKGIGWYDFGGFFVDATTDAEKHINKFKLDFGGKEVNVDKKFYPLTITGKIMVFLYWLKMRRRPEFLRAKTLQSNSYPLIK